MPIRDYGFAAAERIEQQRLDGMRADAEWALSQLSLCDRVVAVLGDDNTYPCRLPVGHDGQCEPDYEDTYEPTE